MINDSAINKISKNKLEKLVKDNTSWRSVMIYFRDNHGYKNIKSNKTLKKRCIKENISFEHFNKGSRNKIALDEVNKNHIISSTQLKKRLLEEKTLKEICTGCGLGNIWNNKPIVLQLSHVSSPYNVRLHSTFQGQPVSFDARHVKGGTIVL